MSLNRAAAPLHRAAPAARTSASPTRPVDARADSSAPSAPPTSDGSFREALLAAGQRIDGADREIARAMRRAGRGAGLDAGALLRLQGQVYRWSLTVDLASKVVHQAVDGVKQVLSQR